MIRESVDAREIHAAVARVLSGDVESFGIIVDAYRGPVWKWAAYALEDLHETQEIVQQTFVEAFRHIEQFEQGRDMGWLSVPTKPPIGMAGKPAPDRAAELADPVVAETGAVSFGSIVAAGENVSLTEPAPKSRVWWGNELVGLDVRSGSRLTVQSYGEGVSVAFGADEANLTLFENTDVVLKGGNETDLTIELKAGEAEIHVLRQGYACEVQTGAGVARAIGTRFRVRYNETEDEMKGIMNRTMMVAVLSGVVAVGQNQLRAGEDITVRTGVPKADAQDVVARGTVESVNIPGNRITMQTQPTRAEAEAETTLELVLTPATQVLRRKHWKLEEGESRDETLSMESVVAGRRIAATYDPSDLSVTHIRIMRSVRTSIATVKAVDRNANTITVERRTAVSGVLKTEEAELVLTENTQVVRRSDAQGQVRGEASPVPMESVVPGIKVYVGYDPVDLEVIRITLVGPEDAR